MDCYGGGYATDLFFPLLFLLLVSAVSGVSPGVREGQGGVCVKGRCDYDAIEPATALLYDTPKWRKLHTRRLV